jgi:hypothetical protein
MCVGVNVSMLTVLVLLPFLVAYRFKKAVR